MKAGRTIILIGLRAGGKTSVGALASRELGRELIDLDTITAGRLGARTAGEAFARAGEGAFREAESAALAEAMVRRGRVIALGGGTPTAPGAAAMLARARDAGEAWIAYLRATPPTLRERLGRASVADRPTLTGRGTIEEVEAVFAARDGAYRALADVVIETDGRSIEDVAMSVVRAARA